MIDHGWIDRCLGSYRPVPWEPTAIVAAHAAARAALDGETRVPSVEAKSHAPQRVAEITWMVAHALLASGRDATAQLDAAFAAADAIIDDGYGYRDRLLAWVAIDLQRYDAKRAARWAAAIRDADYQPELAAHQVAASGDLSLAALPPMWGLRTDVEYWHGYPRWIGSAAAAACVALASDQAVASPHARAFVEQAEQLTAKVDEDWRTNRENRALALAWARVGDLERSMAAASRMPGSERSSAIVDVLDEVGGAADLSRLAALASAAMTATRDAPFVLGTVADRAEMEDFIAKGGVAEVTAAFVRQYIARGDLATARKLVDSIPENYSKHYEASLQLECARLATGETTVESIVAALPESYGANLAAAAAQVGCVDVMQQILRTQKYGERIAENVAWSAIASGHLDRALALLRGISYLASDTRPNLHSDLAFAFVRAGRSADAIAVFRAMPDKLEYATFEQMLLGAGYRAIVVLVAAGDVATARVIDAILAPRLAVVGF